MRQETERIMDLLYHTFQGNPWYGNSLLSVLQDISATQALQRFPGGTHNACELVAHMTNWRTFAIEKLKGNEDFDIEVNTSDDWPVIQTNTEEEHHQRLDTLRQTQHQLINLLAVTPDNRLNDIVSGRDYSFRFMLYGIIQHDTYHQGQIALLLKAGKQTHA